MSSSAARDRLKDSPRNATVSELSDSYSSTPFFDRHADFYASDAYGPDAKPWDWDCKFLRFIVENGPEKTLLDVGGGSGAFVDLVKSCLPRMHVTILDPSTKSLSSVKNQSIRKIVGKLPDMDLDSSEKFSYIHEANVFHHLVGGTIGESHNLMKESLLAIKAHLEDTGFLMILEEVWETHVVPRASSAFVYYALCAAQKLNISIPRSLSHYHAQRFKGLVVCMYTVSELESMLNSCGFEIVQSKIHYPPLAPRQARWKKIMCLKTWGQLQIIAKKRDVKSIR